MTFFSEIRVLVGSTNPVKYLAAGEGMLTRHPKEKFIIIPIQADPGIKVWKSPLAPEQPVGARETGFCAINRMKACWRHAIRFWNTYAVTFENGLVPQGKKWNDVCYVALTDGEVKIIARGESVETEFDAPEDASPEVFDQAMKVYQSILLPKLKAGRDLYLDWTANNPDGPKTRGHFLTRCLVKALNELSQVKGAKEVIKGCANAGMSASAGPRYRGMLWMRDLAYTAPEYLAQGFSEECHAALKQISLRQCEDGKLPIVSVPKEREKEFLLQRLCGTPEDPYWQLQLEKCGFTLPLPTVFLNTLSVEDLKTYYHTLLAFQKELGDGAPGPSFALRCFMEGTLENITPGTRDSEIHFIRALFFLVEQKNVLEEFSEPLGKALVYLYTNVLDPEDGLPRGADSRDIFADLLGDAKTLTNAVFWYEALQLLSKHAPELEKTSFRKIVSALPQFADPQIDLEGIFLRELERLVHSIESKLLFEKGEFKPRDFIPGECASKESPNLPKHVTALLKENPWFKTGETVDPQSLALAVLMGFVSLEHYPQILLAFANADSPIGISVFVPISGKTEEESALLKSCNGRVVWPHVSWAVVRALLAMDTPEALNRAEEQRDKLMRLGGYSEWYAMDPETKRPIPGGDPQQGWTASNMIRSVDDFYNYYAGVDNFVKS